MAESLLTFSICYQTPIQHKNTLTIQHKITFTIQPKKTLPIQHKNTLMSKLLSIKFFADYIKYHTIKKFFRQKLAMLRH